MAFGCPPLKAVLCMALPQSTSAPTAASKHLQRDLRSDFPILHQTVNDKQLVYLDNAATSQKPTAVLDAMDSYYRGYNSNVHRGVHHLSAQATTAYEAARAKVACFINATSDREVVYTRNATEAINLVANTWGVANLKQGDEVIGMGGAVGSVSSQQQLWAQCREVRGADVLVAHPIAQVILSVAEHHSNLVPWQLLSQRLGIVLKFVRLTPDNTELDMKVTMRGWAQPGLSLPAATPRNCGAAPQLHCTALQTITLRRVNFHAHVCIPVQVLTRAVVKGHSICHSTCAVLSCPFLASTGTC